MKKTTTLATTIAILVSSLAIANEAPKTEADYQSLLSEQYTLQLNYVQRSGEVKALYRQVFNMAKYQFDKSMPSDGKKKAVVVDLDETMMDNSPYTGWEILNNQPFTGETWDMWNEARETLSTAGAVDFSHYINDNGGTIFYVSNRSNKKFKATTDNLKALGFSGVSEDTVLLKTTTSLKEARFKQIRDMGYDIVLFIGDNLNDFTDIGYRGSNEERIKFVEDNAEQFGTKFFVMPNPIHGGWERGLHPDYSGANNQKKYELRRESILAWDGKVE